MLQVNLYAAMVLLALAGFLWVLSLGSRRLLVFAAFQACCSVWQASTANGVVRPSTGGCGGGDWIGAFHALAVMAGAHLLFFSSGATLVAAVVVGRQDSIRSWVAQVMPAFGREQEVIPTGSGAGRTWRDK